MSSDTSASIARRFFIEQDRLQGGPATELCAPEYTARLAGNPPLDVSGHQTFAAAFYAGFADLRHSIELVMEEGDRAVVRFSLYGTHTGEFMGLAPTGRTITVAATAILHVAGGRVVELWSEFDQLGLLRQLSGTGMQMAAQARGI